MIDIYQLSIEGIDLWEGRGEVGGNLKGIKMPLQAVIGLFL